MAEEPDLPTKQMTTAMLKAFAHPLRRRIIQVFRRREFVRAADIAEALGEPANKISFHLRVLADAGIIVEAPDQARDRRDRVWTAVKHGALNIGDPEHPVADESLGAAVVQGLVDDHNELLRRLIASVPDYLAGRASDSAGTFSRNMVKLTPAEFDAMLERLHRVMREAEDAHDPSQDAAAKVYQIDIVAGPDVL